MQKRAFPLLDLPDLSSCRGAFAFPDALHSNSSFAGVRRCRRRGPIAAQITATDKARRESCTEARSGHPARLTICQILKSSTAIQKRACLVDRIWFLPVGVDGIPGAKMGLASSPSRPRPRRGDGRDAEGGGSRRVRPVQVMANIGERQGVQGSHLQGASTPRPNLSQLAPEKAPESHPSHPPCKHHRYRSETGPSRSPSSRRLS